MPASHTKSKKRKREAEVGDVPEQDFIPLETPAEDSTKADESIAPERTGGEVKKRKKESKKKSKDEKKKGKKNGEDDSVDVKGKKDKKDKIDKKGKEGKEGQEEAPVAEDGTNGDISERKQHRFIVFIGNLPFSATTESVTQHFAKVQPSSVRHRTHKDSGKSKGFAFLEFDNYDRMQTCLKSYHHSTFDDGLSPSRKINVELTVGGGGSKSKARRTKMQARNEKLTEERKRRALQQEKNGEKTKSETFEGDIHPSRRGMIETD